MNTNDLLALANVVKNENVENANTSERIGSLFEQIIVFVDDKINNQESPSGSRNFSISSLPPVNPQLGDEWMIDGIKYTWVGDWIEF